MEEHPYEISVLRRQRQKNHEFEASLGYRIRPSLLQKKKAAREPVSYVNYETGFSWRYSLAYSGFLMMELRVGIPFFF